MEEEKILLDNSLGHLEAQVANLTNPIGRDWGVIVCHPHPVYGGTMANPVVRVWYKSFAKALFPSLRFNFRGVGNSDGDYDNGSGELEDLNVAITFMKKIHGVKRILLVGYSFGSVIAGRAAVTNSYIGLVIAISYPVGLFPDFDKNLKHENRVPVLFFSGDQDEFTPKSRLISFIDSLLSPTKYFIVSSDHFWGQSIHILEEFAVKCLKWIINDDIGFDFLKLS